jgi:prephenate dehydrogenase
MAKKIAVLGTGANGAAIGADARASMWSLSINGQKMSRPYVSVARVSKCRARF